MTMQEVLNKANDGGYMKEWTLTLYPSGFVYVTPKEDETPGMPDKSLPDIMLDAEFWKALGKSLGWKAEFCRACQREHRYVSDCDAWFENTWPEWLYHWHWFIDHLALGGTIEEYFANL